MPKPNDPGWHLRHEQQITAHVDRLLEDARFSVQTIDGLRAPVQGEKTVANTDRTLDFKRRMIELGVHDQELQRQLPTGAVIDVAMTRKVLLFFNRQLGRVRFVSIPPTDSLIQSREVVPLGPQDLQSALGNLPPPLGGGPATTIIFSSAGFTPEASRFATGGPTGTTILVEPNDAGGYTVHGPPLAQHLMDLLDPEGDEEKAARIRKAVEGQAFELTHGGVSAAKISDAIGLPVAKVEEVFNNLAKQGGLAVQRFEGKLVLYSTGVLPDLDGATDMPILDRLKGLFGDNKEKQIKKQIEQFSAAKTQLLQQREGHQKQLDILLKRDTDLSEGYKAAPTDFSKRNIAAQIKQVRTEIGLQQQLTQNLEKKLTVVTANLNQLQLLQQGNAVKVPEGMDLAGVVAEVEQMNESLDADVQIAEEIAGIGSAGPSVAETDFMAQLDAELGLDKPAEKAPSKPIVMGTATPEPAEPAAAPDRRAESASG